MNQSIATMDDVKRLVQKEAEWCVSIFLPTHRVSQYTQEDQIRLKNMIKEAEDQLGNQGYGSASQLLEPLEKILSDREFWNHQLDGLAIFLSEDLFQRYHAPMPFDQSVSVSDRFHVKPLIPLLSGRDNFYVLCLSQNQTRLYKCARFSIEEISLGDTPTSLEEALSHDDQEKQLQFHTGTGEGKGQRSAMFHGHGVGKDDQKDRILRFCQTLDKGLQDIIDPETSPVVIASVDYLAPIFKEASGLKMIMEDTITGNPEALDTDELLGEAWEIMAPHLTAESSRALEQFWNLSGSGKTSTDLSEIVKASAQGRVGELFVNIKQSEYGRYDLSKDEIVYTDDAQTRPYDLVDYAISQTLLNGGDVYALDDEETPESSKAAAIFRY